jgi:membrane associated rhomboid family serine protease
MAQYRPGGFSALPMVIKNLLIINGLVYLAEISLGKMYPIVDMFSLHNIKSPDFRIYQLITHMFLHDPRSFFHVFFNMFALWMFGTVLEQKWGPKRFLTFYLVCGLGGALAMIGIDLYEYNRAISSGILPDINNMSLGASGAVFGVLAAYAYLFPNTILYIQFFIPMKAKWFVLIYAGIELSLALYARPGDNIGHWAHLGGALAGFLWVLITNRTNRKTFY